MFLFLNSPTKKNLDKKNSDKDFGFDLNDIMEKFQKLEIVDEKTSEVRKVPTLNFFLIFFFLVSRKIQHLTPF